LIERVGVSNVSFSDAVKKAVQGVRMERNVYWFQVLEQRGKVSSEGEIEYQVIIRMGV
jgi:flavin-binding protein dodecin